MKKRIVLAVVLELVFTGLCVFIFSGMVNAATIKVPEDYPTIQAAINVATTGDTIQVAAGTYNESITIDEQITLQGAGASSTIIGDDGGLTEEYRIRIAEGNCKIDGFTLQMQGTGGDNDYIIKLMGSAEGNITITNNILTCTNNTVEYCIHEGEDANFENIIISSNTIEGDMDSAMFFAAKDSTISSNTIELSNSAAVAGIYIKGVSGEGNNVISGNIITNISPATAITITGSNSSIYGNKIYSCASGIRITVSNCNIYNNLIYDLSGTDYPMGINVTCSAGSTISGNVIVNNTISNIQGTIVGLGIYMDVGTEGTISDTTIANNIITSSYCGIYIDTEEGGTIETPTADYNCVYNNTTQYYGISAGTHDVNSDPLFTDSSNNDYTLQSGSPCISAGTSTNAPSTDFNGDTRKSPPDIGCYESQGGPSTTWYLAEGCTAGIFDTWILMGNPSSSDATVTFTFYKPDGTTVESSTTVSANSRKEIKVDDISGMDNTSFSTKAVSTQGIILERAMYWNDMTGGHNSIGVTSASATWYLAEGCTSGNFEAWILLCNPSSSDATVTFTFYKPDGTTVESSTTVSANSRKDIKVDDISGMDDTSFSTKVVSTQNIVVERSMYWDAGGVTKAGGHCSIGVTSTATAWYLSESCTSGSFDEWILIQNPNSSDATCQITFYDSDGNTVTGDAFTVTANSRYTVNVESSYSQMADKSFSAKVESTNSVGIVVDRAMYWDAGGVTWEGGHCSTGVTSTAATWYLAEGCTSGDFDTWVLICNPSASAATVTFTFYKPDGNTVSSSTTVAAASRKSIRVNDISDLGSTAFSTKITSTQGITVDRAQYWTAGGVIWVDGHCSHGV